MAKEPIVLAGVGDVILDRAEPNTAFASFGPHLKAADIGYVNMEQVLADEGDHTNLQSVSHGTRFVQPYVDFGVDIVSCATNHGGDWGEYGIMETIKTLDGAGVAHMGTGANLDEARKPVILERKGTKVGFLNYCSVARENSWATEDRAGVCPIDVWTFYKQVDYQPGTPPHTHSVVKKESMDMVLEDIAKLRPQVDVLVVMLHWGLHIAPALIPDYCMELGHAIIDAGADMIVGAHTHILKAMEIYKGKVIIHSLGNCLIDFGDNFHDEKWLNSLDVHYDELAYLTPQSIEDRKMTMVFKAYIDDGKIDKVTFLPMIVNDENNPTVVDRNNGGQKVVDYMRYLTDVVHFDTKYDWIDDDEVLVHQ